MENEHHPNRDELPCFTTASAIPIESKLTHGNKEPNSDYGDTFDGDPTFISDHSDKTEDGAAIEKMNVNADICDNRHLHRTNSHIECEKETGCNNKSFILDSTRKYHSDSEEICKSPRKPVVSPLFKSKSLRNIKIDSRNVSGVKYTDDVPKNSSLFPNQNKQYALSNNNTCEKDSKNVPSSTDKNTSLGTFNTCEKGLDVKLSKSENLFDLVQNFDSIIHNAMDDNIDKIRFENSNGVCKNSISKVNSLPLNLNTTIASNAATYPFFKSSKKSVTFNKNNSPPKRYQRSVGGSSKSEIRRFSRTRLSQWGSRNKKPPVSIQTSLPIVEGIDEQHLWSEAKALNSAALLVLWWTLLALVMYILSFYDLWSDCSVAYLFYQKGRYPEYRWCIISLIVLVNSYFLQCCFSYYEVTHALHNHYGRLSSKKYAVPLFVFMPWIIVFIGIYDTYKNKYTRRLESAYIMMFIEVIFESLAQTSLQLNAICVYADDPRETVSALQWCSASSSILFLSMGISYSVIFYNNKDATQVIKFLFCVFGGITIVSRLLLCSSWALQEEIFWAVPFLAGLFTTSFIWLLLRTFPCFGYKEFLTQYEINNLPMALVTSSSWVTSFVFNCFSPSGIPVSVLMVVLAGVDFSIKNGHLTQFDISLQVINVCLTAFVLLCNIVFAFVPKCKILGRTWIEGEGEDEDDPYHFRFY